MKSPLHSAVQGTGALLLGLGASGLAQARSDVSWSIGIGAPGVSVGLANGHGYGYVGAPVVYAGTRVLGQATIASASRAPVSENA